MAEVDALQKDLTEFKTEVRNQFEGVREDLKELTAALRELIRLDGDIRRIEDRVNRIGAEVDDHEDRIRDLAASSIGATKAASRFDKFADYSILMLISALVGGLAARLMA